ncbi:MAG: hypothetical protein OEL89_00355 [Candidatus Peregrinibacteria bacterium]|nr:hypothetical protein [Candidatus Peregrinibacteria bacterium]
MKKAYLWRILLSIDQFFNVLIFNGYEDETISSHAGKKRHRKKWACLLCKILDFVDKKHCAKSIELDEGEKIE